MKNSNCFIYPMLLYSTLSRVILVVFLISCVTHQVTCFTSTPVGQQQISFGMRKLASSSNQFGFDLMRSMDRSTVTMALCPFCVFSSLTMMLTGADGTTATSLRHALYLWGMQSEEINLASYDLMNHLGVNTPSHSRSLSSRQLVAGATDTSAGTAVSRPFSMASNRANVTSVSSLLNHASNDLAFLTNIYVQRDFPINYHYHMLLQRFYKTVIHPLDFHFNGEETRQHINAKVEKQTLGKIRDILPDRRSPATQMLLLSALYFKGVLDLNMSPVDPYLQSNGERSPAPIASSTAYVTASSNIVPTVDTATYSPEITSEMIFGREQIILEAKSARLRYKFDRYLNATTVEMPFKNSLATLVLMMPGDYNLEMLLTRLSAQILSDVVSSLEVKRVNIKIPRLTFEASNTNLTWALTNLGLTDLFKPGFSQLHGISDYKWLAVSDIISKTYLDIKENSLTSGIHSSTVSPVTGTNVSPNINPLYPMASHVYSSNHGPVHQNTLNKGQPPVISSPSPSPGPMTGHQMSHINNLLNTHAQQHQQPPPTLYHHASPSHTVNHFTHPFSLSSHHNIRLKLPINSHLHQRHRDHQLSSPPSPASITSTPPTADTIDVNFNKPFVYFVIDTVSGLIMVMGKVGREPVSYRLPV